MALTLADYLRDHQKELDEKSLAFSETTAFTSYGYERDLILTKYMIQDGLSQLGTSGDGTRIVYLTLALNGLDVSDVSLLISFPDIQRLELSQNCIRDLSALTSLKHLAYVDVSFNRLTTALDTVCSPNLVEANYSHNEIEILGNLSCHRCLTTLKLASNQITEICGLENLHSLTYLDLSNNRIECITNLDSLPLKELYLSGNSIEKIENLECLSSLQIIDLSSNQLSSMDGLQGHNFLQQIYLAENDIMYLGEITHVAGLRMLRILNLQQNPIESQNDFKLRVVYKIPQLEQLDHSKLTPQDKVTAFNLFSPPLSIRAARDHMTNITKLIQHPSWLKFSTLTSIDEPYPMLVLCGPRGSGKATLCKQLVVDFPDFFGFGVSHTTRAIRKNEEHGKDYNFVSKEVLLKGIETGEFLETSSEADDLYGLSSTALEQVACQGLACIAHFDLQGVLSLKNTHFEPRYVLMMPYSPKVHKQRLEEKGCYTKEEITQVLESAKLYKKYNCEMPGFFDTAINSDSLSESYQRLKVLVMTYGGITPDSSSSSPRPTTQLTATTTSTTDDEEDDDDDTSQEEDGDTKSTHTHPPASPGPLAMAKSWSRPQSARTNSASTGRVVSGSRRYIQAIAAVAGKENTPTSRCSITEQTHRSTSEVALKPTLGTVGRESSSESTPSRDSVESFTRLYSARGFSPTSEKTESTADIETAST